MEVIIQPHAEEASRLAACMISRLIREKPNAVLGLATGSTPLLLYRELVRMHREEGLDFAQITTFNLDEYVGLAPDHPNSYNHFMHKHLFRLVNVNPANIHIPNGLTEDIPTSCEAYERTIRAAGGIDLQVLGIGGEGHIGFNEPTSSLASRTRIKTLTPKTLADNAKHFEDPNKQPHHVITMGIGTVLDSGRLLLLAFGKAKASTIAKSVEGPITSMVPASALQLHQKATVILDSDAASDLALTEYYHWVYEHKPQWQRDEL